MNKLNKLLYISIIAALLLTLLIIFLPNSINNYYDNPEIYDTGFSYYMWKFRPIDASWFARITGWLFFLAHITTVFVLSQKLKDDMVQSKRSIKKKKPKKEISKYNYYLLYANLFFIVLHYLHTWIWYDALAQDTPVWSSQGSVIVMLVLILIMENGRRGLFFGKKMPFPKESVAKIMKSHGAIISVAIVFTFWYHPMEFTWGHLFGFFYMYLLFIQMSLSRTKIHNNKYWKLALEVTVLFHGTFVAISQDNAPWAMFLFGFAAIFFITQIYGLNLTKKQIKISQIVFLVVTILIYSGLFTDYTIVDINEVIRIPFIEYLLIFVIVYLVYLPIYLDKKHELPLWIKRTSIILLITILTIAGATVIFINSPYQAEPEMYDYITLDTDVTMHEHANSIVYEPDNYDMNIVFIPGGKVVPEAYSYLASKLANEGFKVTIIKPLFNLAILMPNQADDFLEDEKVNVLIGHSLGGVVASMVTAKNPEVDYLIMMGAYNIKPITTAKTLAITAEHDIQLDLDKYNQAMEDVTFLTEFELEGGNHAYFGYYGEQRGDGEAEMPNRVQQDSVIELIRIYLTTQ